MQPYLLMFGALAAGAVYGVLTRRTQRDQTAFHAFAMVLWWFGAFRYEVGADWYSYEAMFFEDMVRFDPGVFETEYLFHGFFWSLAKMGFSYVEATTILFTISFLLKLVAIRRLSPAPNVSLVVYFTSAFVFLDVNGVRQGLGLGFTLLALCATGERRVVAFIAWTIAATMVHVSALIFLPFYWVAHWSPPRTTYLFAGALFVAIRPVFEQLLLDERILGVILTEGQIGKVMYYAHGENFARSVQLLDPALLQRVFIFLGVLMLWPQLRLDLAAKRMLLNCYTISFLLFVGFGSFVEIGFRLSYYYKVADIFLLAGMAVSGRDVFSRLVLGAFVVIYALLLLFRILQLPDGGLIPYNSWLF